MLSNPILYSPEDIARITGGRLRLPPVVRHPITGVSSGPRKTTSGDVYVTVNAFRGIAVRRARMAVARGAVCIVTSTPAVSVDLPVVLVGDPNKAHEALARHARSQFQGTTVAITGSVGKTSTKDMIAHVLRHCGTVQSTYQNENVAQFLKDLLAELRPRTDAAVFEVSMTKPGDILAKANLVKPDIAVVTSIGTSHIGNHEDGAVEWILEEKASIFESLGPQGIAVIPDEDPFFPELKAKAEARTARIVSCGTDDQSDIRLLSYQMHPGESHVEISVAGEIVTYVIGQPGYHHIRNSLLCAGVLHASGRDLAAMRSLSRFSPTGRRMERHALTMADGGALELLDDSYNASPASIRMMLRYFSTRSAVKRKILVLGDIRELGSRADELHRSLIEDVRSSAADLFIAVGPNMKTVFDQAGLPGTSFDHADEAASHLVEIAQADDLVSVKASHGTELNKVVNALRRSAKKVANAGPSWSVDQNVG